MHPAEKHILKNALAANPELPKDNWKCIHVGLRQGLWLFSNSGSGASIWLRCETTSDRNKPWKYSYVQKNHD